MFTCKEIENLEIVYRLKNAECERKKKTLLLRCYLELVSKKVKIGSCYLGKAQEAEVS